VATVGKIVSRALRLIGVLDPNEPLEAEDAETGIEALNAMVRRWEANGQALGWSDVSNPSEEMPSPPELDECIAFNLAVTVAPEYDASVSPMVAMRAAESMNDLRRDREVEMPIEPILDVPMPSTGGAYRFGFPGNWNS
jgi:hypothetical protein